MKKIIIIIILTIFSIAGYSQSSWRIAKIDGIWCYEDTLGHLKLKTDFDKIWYFQEGLSSVMKNNKWGYIDSTGKIIFWTDFDFVSNFYNGLAKVLKNNKWGYIDKTGKLIVPLIYDGAEDFSEAFGIVKICSRNCHAKAFSLKRRYWCKEKWAIADTNGKVTITKYDYIQNFHNGYAKVFKIPWWVLRWGSKFYNIDWKRIDKNFIEYDIPKESG